MKKILVTGGAGFIGTNLIKKLVEDGHRVVSLDDYETGYKENHVDGVKYIEGDIEMIQYIKGDFDVVYHLAALARIQPSFENPLETYRVNTTGTQIVCEWARKWGVKMIYSGSSSRWHDPQQSPYATYKKLGEDIVKMYKKVYDCDFEITRFYNVYGPNEIVDGKWAAVIGIFRHQVLNDKPITIVGDGEQRRDFTHVDDIVSALVKIGLGDYKHEDAWELGTGQDYSINEIYEMFCERFGELEKVNLSDQKGNYRRTLRENDDSLEVLDWKPTDRLKEYILSL